MKKTLCFLFFFVLVVATANAQIINIPVDKPTIQAGIDSASNGDTVLVEENTYFENINFKGKAITVASLFLVDGDTSHISKTIIDGSQPAHPDTASTVTMWSGEDTTSVLTGFTITGGSGTIVSNVGILTEGEGYRSGGGIIIYNSGGKVTQNIIKDNHLTDGIVAGIIGCGLFACVNHNHTAIIRNNTILHNSGTANNGWGGGISLYGGRIIAEYNSLMYNTLNMNQFSLGAGILHECGDITGTIDDVIIRNNYISKNEVDNVTNEGLGGGIGLIMGFNTAKVHVYNNIVSENFAEGWAGGMFFYESRSAVFNNTFEKNEASKAGNSLEFDPGNDVMLYNNIIWGMENELSDYYFWEGAHTNSLKIFNNLLKEPFGDEDYLTAFGNTYLEPSFKPDSYELAEFSPGIGQGVDSIQIAGSWYFAPSFDFNGNIRPHPIDAYVDAGAYESPYEGFVQIPDTAFLYALIDEGVDTNVDSLISYSEAELIISLNVVEKGIVDLTGIEAFVNLDTLDCSYNDITSLDLSSNTMLKEFDCNQSQLNSLDVSQNTLLDRLSLWGNELTSLDISNNPALVFLYIQRNQIDTLDLSNNTSLEYFSCRGNQFTNLDVSNNISLRRLRIDEMPTLFEVCVWELPFPPDGVEIDTTDSPNVCFETDCNGACGTTGIITNSPTELSIYPNPAIDILTIETNRPGQHTVEIASVNGQLLFIDKIEEPTFHIDLSSFQKGLYFITVRSSDFVRTEKIIKL